MDRPEDDVSFGNSEFLCPEAGKHVHLDHRTSSVDVPHHGHATDRRYFEVMLFAPLHTVRLAWWNGLARKYGFGKVMVPVKVESCNKLLALETINPDVGFKRLEGPALWQKGVL